MPGPERRLVEHHPLVEAERVGFGSGLLVVIGSLALLVSPGLRADGRAVLSALDAAGARSAVPRGVGFKRDPIARGAL